MFENFCKKSINNYLDNNFDLTQLPSINPNSLTNHVGLYVSLFSGITARGCLGILQKTTDIPKTLAYLSILAATRDDRYTPIKKNELIHISVGVWRVDSIIKVDQLKNINIKEQGVFMVGNKGSSIILPYVSVLYSLDHEKILKELITKAKLCPQSINDLEFYALSAKYFGNNSLFSKWRS